MTGTPAPYVRLIEHLFRARLTAKSDASGEWRYAWTEQRFEVDTGAWADAVPPRLGTLGPTPADDRNYATELSGLELPAQGELYWILLKGSVGGMDVYEVQGRVASSHSGNVGDGGSTAITVTHNLGTQDVVVVLIRNSDGHCVNVAWRVTGVNTIVLDFGLYAPALDEYRVTVLASGGGWSTNVILVYDAVNVSYVNSTVVNYTTSTVVNYTDVSVNYTNVAFAYLSNSTVNVAAGVTLFFVGLGLGGNLNFANLSLSFGSTVSLFFGGSPVFFTANTSWVIAAGFRLTVNGPGVLVLNLPVKFYDGWWLHYRDVDLTGESQVDDLNLPAFPDSNRVVCRVMIDQDCVLTGMIPTLDGGSGQVIILINDNPLFDLTLGHAHAGSDAQNRFFCPCSEDLVLCFNAGALVWYDPDLEKWRVIGFCCDKGARTEGTLAAAGSSQGDAAPVVTDGVFVTGADDTKGVVLQSKVGALTVLYNDSADSLKVYPPAGETLEPLAADAPEIVLGFEGMVFARTDVGEWAVINRDIFAKVSDSDTTHDYLQNKVVAGANIVITVLNAGADEALEISAPLLNSPRWTKYTKTYADFSVAATSRTLTLAGLSVRTVLHEAVIKHSVQFGGGGIIGYSITLSNSAGGAAGLYGSHAAAVPVTDTARTATVPIGPDGYPTAAAWDVLVKADAGADNLDLATAGVVDVWLLTSTLP